VFYIAAAIYTVGAIFYLVFGSGEVQSWAKEIQTDTELSIYREPINKDSTKTTKRVDEEETEPAHIVSD